MNADLTIEALENPKPNNKIDRSIYAAAFDWYTSIVFAPRYADSEPFDLSYLLLFDKYFFQTVQYIIQENQDQIFSYLVESLSEGMLPVTEESKIWDYQIAILQLDRQIAIRIEKELTLSGQIRKLATEESKITTQKELDDWRQKFQLLSERIDSYLSEKDKKLSNLQRDVLSSATSRFKHNNLLSIVETICAYCLYKRKPEYIRMLWEYKQPPDSDAIWLGTDIVPGDAREIITKYFESDPLESRFSFWEGHHGASKYIKEYFVLLLAHGLAKLPMSSTGAYETIDKFEFLDNDSWFFANVEQSTDELLAVTDELKRDQSILIALGFKANSTDELFENRVKPLLRNIKQSAAQKLSLYEKTWNIDPSKVEVFKKETLEFYERSARLKQLFRTNELYENLVAEKKNQGPDLYGIVTTTIPRSSFFDDWYIQPFDLSKHFGSDLAISEDSYLLGEISGICTKKTIDQVDEILDQILSKPIIIVSNLGYLSVVRLPKFKPLQVSSTSDQNGLIGSYELDGNSVPVFRIFSRNKFNFLILDQSRLGRLIQYSPVDGGAPAGELMGYWLVNVEALSEKQIRSTLESQPDWLKAKGDGTAQQNYLETLVSVSILERLAFKKSIDFVGYAIENNEDQKNGSQSQQV